jgi:hypothetical protein
MFTSTSSSNYWPSSSSRIQYREESMLLFELNFLLFYYKITLNAYRNQEHELVQRRAIGYAAEVQFLAEGTFLSSTTSAIDLGSNQNPIQ